LESFHNSQEEGASNVSALLASLTSSSVNDEAEEVLKHRIVTTGESIRKTVVQADLYGLWFFPFSCFKKSSKQRYLTLRMFSNSDIRGEIFQQKWLFFFFFFC
jgi:hypothetical protein